MAQAMRFSLGFAAMAWLAGCSGAPAEEASGAGASGQAGAGGTGGEVPGSGGGPSVSDSGLGSGGSSGAAGAWSGSGGGGGAGMGGAGGAGPAGGASSGGASSGGAPPVGPSVLTAGVWDDNRNFGHFLAYRAAQIAQAPTGILGFTEADHKAAFEASKGWLLPHQKLDVALVIDTTGSMTDEMSYLKAELIHISDQIAKLHPNAEQRWALIVYRDVGDAYVVSSFGFKNLVTELQSKLALQSAGGGGDFPEAPDAAFEQMNQLSWRSGPEVSRLAFWVADAPHHADKAAAFKAALQKTQQLGVHVYPVASSGIDEHTELTMRSAAQLTGGRYMFLTNDSGAGGPHKEPSIPCYFVTKLDDAMVRMVDIEMSGKYHEPAASEILRTGGDPENGACTLESGATVLVY